MEEDWPNPYQPPAASLTLEIDEEESAAAYYRRRKRYILLAVGAYVAIAGFVVGVFEEGAPLLRVVDLVSLIAFAVAVVAWCRLDCQQREIQLWPLFALMVICCPGPLITLIIYLFVSRGMGGFWASAKLAGFGAILLAGMMVSGFAGAVAAEFLR